MVWLTRSAPLLLLLIYSVYVVLLALGTMIAARFAVSWYAQSKTIVSDQPPALLLSDAVTDAPASESRIFCSQNEANTHGDGTGNMRNGFATSLQPLQHPVAQYQQNKMCFLSWVSHYSPTMLHHHRQQIKPQNGETHSYESQISNN